jgi:hypothetical protein
VTNLGPTGPNFVGIRLTETELVMTCLKACRRRLNEFSGPLDSLLAVVISSRWRQRSNKRHNDNVIASLRQHHGKLLPHVAIGSKRDVLPIEESARRKVPMRLSRTLRTEAFGAAQCDISVWTRQSTGRESRAADGTGRIWRTIRGAAW